MFWVVPLLARVWAPLRLRVNWDSWLLRTIHHTFKFNIGISNVFVVNSLSPALCLHTEGMERYSLLLFYIHSNGNPRSPSPSLWRSIAPTQQPITITNFINSVKAGWMGGGAALHRGMRRTSTNLSCPGLNLKRKKEKKTRPPTNRNKVRRTIKEQ